MREKKKKVSMNKDEGQIQYLKEVMALIRQ